MYEQNAEIKPVERIGRNTRSCKKEELLIVLCQSGSNGQQEQRSLFAVGYICFSRLTLFLLESQRDAKFPCVRRVERHAYTQLNVQTDTLANKLSVSLPRHHPLYSASCWIPRLLRGEKRILMVANNIQSMPDLLLSSVPWNLLREETKFME
jgi:hypothetical protein